MSNYDKLRELLNREKFPHVFIFKFIGKNSAQFDFGVQSLEKKFPRLQKQSRRTTANQQFVSLSYVLTADTKEEIIEVYQFIALIEEIVVVL